MIKLFRISTSQHINDITGTGARIYGGRWNHAGYPVVYVSGSRSLAALEFLVHVPMALAPEDLSIVINSFSVILKCEAVFPIMLILSPQTP